MARIIAVVSRLTERFDPSYEQYWQVYSYTRFNPDGATYDERFVDLQPLGRLEVENNTWYFIPNEPIWEQKYKVGFDRAHFAFRVLRSKRFFYNVGNEEKEFFINRDATNQREKDLNPDAPYTMEAFIREMNVYHKMARKQREEQAAAEKERRENPESKFQLRM